MPLLLLLALLVPIAPPAVHGQGTAACHASDFTSLQTCLADPAAADPDTAFEIVLDGDITLGIRERIVVQDKHNLVISGASGAAISETVERMESSGGNNRYLMLVSGGSGVTLRNVAIRDPAGSDLSARCRAGADPDRPNRW